jgi:hypothetical protein
VIWLRERYEDLWIQKNEERSMVIGQGRLVEREERSLVTEE